MVNFQIHYGWGRVRLSPYNLVRLHRGNRGSRWFAFYKMEKEYARYVSDFTPNSWERSYPKSIPHNGMKHITHHIVLDYMVVQKRTLPLVINLHLSDEQRPKP
ncbi:hypothetical protein AVEN_254493-1 [Araneus ventricosus]|uniref:Uncharacterized protein n=1 Tax=Araneus ventricosus TaxID=182803 RepID=A0A4Y2LU91_ARAVE|nr:hypothetical protein AVEN_254493-1 [Araneus ventricosus]